MINTSVDFSLYEQIFEKSNIANFKTLKVLYSMHVFICLVTMKYLRTDSDANCRKFSMIEIHHYQLSPGIAGQNNKLIS